jgi:hypothetical protein
VGDIVCEVSDDSGNYQTRLPQKKLNAFTAAIMQAVEESRAGGCPSCGMTAERFHALLEAEARASLFAKELEDAKADAESWEDQCDDARKLALQQAARAEKAEAREAELQHIDEVLARRPALADCKTRIDKIEFAISTAKRAEKADAREAALRGALELARVCVVAIGGDGSILAAVDAALAVKEGK